MDEIPKAKVSMLGDSGVGKSSILKRKVDNSFTEDTTPTVGATTAKISENVGNVIIDLEIWDTAGQERFQSLSPFYIINSKVIIFVYSINNKSSFDSINKWYNIAQANINTFDPYYILVANKNDLASDEVKNYVSEKEGKSKADSLNMDFISVSAKNNWCINEIFQLIATKYYNKIKNKEHVLETKTVDLVNDQQNDDEKKSCC